MVPLSQSFAGVRSDYLPSTNPCYYDALVFPSMSTEVFHANPDSSELRPLVEAPETFDLAEWQRLIDGLNESAIVGRESKAQSDVYYTAHGPILELHDARARYDARDDSVFVVQGPLEAFELARKGDGEVIPCMVIGGKYVPLRAIRGIYEVPPKSLEKIALT